MKKLRSTAALLMAAVMISGLLGCAESRSLFTRSVEEELPLWRIVVFPFTVVRPPEGEVMVRSPVGGDMFRTGPVAPGAEDIMTELLMEHVEGRRRFFPLGRAAVEEFIGTTLEKEPYGFGPLQALKLSQRHDADGVLVGFIYAFRERVGTGYSVDTPASVTFDLYLLEAETGRVLWKANYSHTQQPVSENVLDLETYVYGGIRWLTATELARLGLKKMFERFPRLAERSS